MLRVLRELHDYVSLVQQAVTNTTIIIRNSTTFTFNSWMVTSRGYQTKYNLRDKTLP